MKAKVHVTLKPGVLDPQGRAVLHALEALGFGGVDGVRQGKFIELDLKESDPKKAEAMARARAGSVRIAGTADTAKLSLTGAGDIDGEALKVGSADVSILGAGDIDFASDGRVAISIMGPGDVTVKGKAQCTTTGVGPGEAHCAP